MIMDEEYAHLLAQRHNCTCLGAQTDERDQTVFYWFNERTGNKSSFTAKNEVEFFHKLMLRRMIA
jgi:hypothetical protein